MDNNGGKKQKTIKIRIAVLVDLEGNWAAAGWKGAKDKEALEMAAENDGISGAVQTCFVTVEVPQPKPLELTAIAVEAGEQVADSLDLVSA